MSIYGYLVCHDCKQQVWLGKAIHEDYRPKYFHIGQADHPPHWERTKLNQVIWRFLADHAGHEIQVSVEGERREGEDEYQQIGGDEDGDISFADYLDGWEGLRK